MGDHVEREREHGFTEREKVAEIKEYSLSAVKAVFKISLLHLCTLQTDSRASRCSSLDSSTWDVVYQQPLAPPEYQNTTSPLWGLWSKTASEITISQPPTKIHGCKTKIKHKLPLCANAPICASESSFWLLPRTNTQTYPHTHMSF